MKEINLLPKWYKDNRRRKLGLRSQYMALCGLFVIMVVWSLITSSSISRAKAELSHTQLHQDQAKSTFKEFNELQGQISELKKKAGILKQIDSKINVANIISELSFLIDRKIVLSKIDFKAEQFAKSKSSNQALSGVRLARSRSSGTKNELPLGEVRFKTVMSGMAAETSDVGKLVRKLEDSPYFCSVSLSFSRNKELKTNSISSEKNRAVSEFEISSYLANYKVEK